MGRIGRVDEYDANTLYKTKKELLHEYNKKEERKYKRKKIDPVSQYLEYGQCISTFLWL